MGHVWDPKKGFLTFFKKIYRLLLNDGLVILSNDLCDACHKKGSLKVDADSTAMFFKPNKGYVAAQAINTGLFKVCFENIYSYDRVGRGVKVREILILKSLTPIDGNYCRTTG